MPIDSPPPSWTFAEQASTYRFWGLLGALVSVFLGVVMLQQSIVLSARESDAIPFGTSAIVYSASSVSGSLMGLALGLLVVRWRTVLALILLAVVGGGMTALLALPAEDIGLSRVFAARFLGYVVQYAFVISVPAVLADGRGGRIAFASAFGVLTALQVPLFPVVLSMASDLLRQWGALGGVLAGAAGLGVATLLLLPVRRDLFTVAPGARHVSLVPQHREPALVVGLAALPWLAAIGFALATGTGPVSMASAALALKVAGVAAALGAIAMTYWLYRVHGEVAAICPSRQLLTPRVAALTSLLVPLAVPIQLLTLGSVLREGAARSGAPLADSQRWLSLWSVLLPPIAMGMVQAQLNQMSARHEASQAK